MCRCKFDELENTEEKEQVRYEQAINLLRALVFLFQAERSGFRYVINYETGEVEFLEPASS